MRTGPGECVQRPIGPDGGYACVLHTTPFDTVVGLLILTVLEAEAIWAGIAKWLAGRGLQRDFKRDCTPAYRRNQRVEGS